MATAKALTLYVAFFLVLLATDAATKMWNATPDWGMHDVAAPWWMWIGPMLMLVGSFWKVTRIWCIIGAAGMFGNMLWTLGGPVPNPWVAEVNGSFDISDLYLLTMLQPSTVAFNSADVMIWVAQVGLVMGTSLWAMRVVIRYAQQRAYTHPARRARYLTNE